MNRDNIYYFNGTAYAGKSTMVRMLAEKYGGIVCEENYHDSWPETLDSREDPCLTYTRDLKDWQDFIRRTPDEYEAWVRGVTLECERIELKILETLDSDHQKVFVDTNITPETLWRISDTRHVLIMLADPEISVRRFFERPDREKQFLYRLLMEEPDPEAAKANFQACLERINSQAAYDAFLNSGFQVILRDDRRSPEETMRLAEKAFGFID